jgi:hypothetical protein
MANNFVPDTFDYDDYSNLLSNNTYTYGDNMFTGYTPEVSQQMYNFSGNVYTPSQGDYYDSGAFNYSNTQPVSQTFVPGSIPEYNYTPNTEAYNTQPFYSEESSYEPFLGGSESSLDLGMLDSPVFSYDQPQDQGWQEFAGGNAFDPYAQVGVPENSAYVNLADSNPSARQNQEQNESQPPAMSEWEQIIARFGRSANSLLPLLFLGSGALASRSAGQMANTLEDVAVREQEKETGAMDMLQEFLSSGFVPSTPDASEYQQGNVVDWSPTDVLARYREAIDDPRYGLQEYMDAEGGTRAEVAARRSAKGGRTGLNALSNLIAMRDYLGGGRDSKLKNLYQEAGIAAQQDQARLQAAIQQANANITANTARYNTDSTRYNSTLNNMFNAAYGNNNAAAALIAAAQANGSQFNPLYGALGQWLGREGA